MSKKRCPSAESLARTMLIAKTNGCCWYCGVKLKVNTVGFLKSYTVDHCIPLSKDGTNDFWNLVPACAECNEDKADHLLKDYRRIKSKRLTYRRDNDRRVVFYGEQLGLDDSVNTAYEWLHQLNGAMNMFRGMGMLKKRKFKKMIGVGEDVSNNN